MKFKKRLQVTDFEDLDKRLKEFETLNLDEESLVNIEDEYEKISSTIEELKMTIESQR